MRTRWFLSFLFVGLLLAPQATQAQVLGSCGTPDANKVAAAAVPTAPNAANDLPAMTRVPLPGEQAPNFELMAVVGDEIKKIKLSDYKDKWRVVCFYPADFTFV